MFIVAVADRLMGFGLRMTLFNWAGATFLGALVAAVYIYAWGVSLVTERKTPAMRRWLGGLVGIHARPY
jgi:hypothetical protein